MKLKLLSGFLALLTITASCGKNKSLFVTPVPTLPPYTDTGANTFGCLVDGQVFIPGANVFTSSVTLNCYYENFQEEYTFSISGTNSKDNAFHNNITIGGTSPYDFLKEDSIYSLGEQTATFFLGAGAERGVSDTTFKGGVNYHTNATYKGELTIKHYDKAKHIISGTFWFNAFDSVTKKVVHITDGRFDTHYTR